MSHVPKRVACACLLLCAGWSATGTEAQRNAKPLFDPTQWQAASDDKLDALRGGFQIGANLAVSFGFVRSVTINGDLVSETRFTLPDLSNITADQAKLVNAALAQAHIVQNGAGNTVGTPTPTTTARAPASPAAPGAADPVPTAPGSTGATGVVAQAPSPQLPTPSLTAPSAPAAHSGAGISTAAAAPSALPTSPTPTPQPAPSLSPPSGLASLAGAPNAPGLPSSMTVVQNTLNNQTIQSLTVIDTSANSLGMLRAIQSQRSLRDALVGAIGVR